MGTEDVKFNLQNAQFSQYLPFKDNELSSFSPVINIYNPSITANLGIDSTFSTNIDTFSLTSIDSSNLFNNSNFQLPNYNLGIGAFITSSMDEVFKLNETKMNDFLALLKNGLTVNNPAESIVEYSPSKIISHKSSNNDYIAELDKDMQSKVKQLEQFAEANGIPFKITSGYRTREQQIALQKKYANEKGRVAGADSSKHRFGKAIDIDTSSLTKQQCQKLGDYAKSIGMRWGGDFSTYREDWHFDIA